MRNPLALLIFLVWLLLGWWYYRCYSQCCKKQEVLGASPQENVMKQLGPLVFYHSNAKPQTKDGWEALRKSLLDQRKDKSIFEFLGLYRADEKNNTQFADLGLARANETRKLFPELRDDEVRLISKLIEGSTDIKNPFESCDMDWKINTENIKETADHTNIYFPFNSTNKINAKDVEAYLDEAAARVNKSGESIKLVGHTDNVGNDEDNIKLGQRRADIVKSYLLKKNVKSDKIVSSSKGESEPIAKNDTEEGRAKNRRTELHIIK